jgi:hypothetical protein
LASGESIELSYDKDQSGTYTVIGSASYAVDGAVTTKTFATGFRCDDF